MKDYTVEVTENKKIADGLYELTFASTDCGFEGLHCGRFLHMEVPGKLLRRPFCLYKFSETSISVAYAVVGDGTRNMTFLKRGDRLKVTLPLGNGWNLEEKHKKIVLLGGGVGCAPLAYVPVSYPNRKYYAISVLLINPRLHSSMNSPCARKKWFVLPTTEVTA